MTKQLQWVALKDVHDEYGMTLDSAYHAISAGTFPVSTYKLGRLIVIDRVVHEQFFLNHREAGLLALRNNKMVSEPQSGSM